MNQQNKDTVKIIEALDLVGYVVESMTPQMQIDCPDQKTWATVLVITQAK